MTARLLFLIFLTLPSFSTYSNGHIIESADRQTVMIELYTSEGCSSCPPAEKHLNSYLDHKALWKDYIPMAFHVDYWDYIGWEDRYARAAHSARQGDYAKLQRSRTVYTPAFFVNGSNWRPGIFSKTAPETTGKKTGKLSLTLSRKAILGHYSPVTKTKEPLELNVVLLGMGLATKIKAGENAGHDARHEFVVLNHVTKTTSSNQWKINWPVIDNAVTRKNVKQFAIAAWISRPGSPVPLQATGGMIANDYVK